MKGMTQLLRMEVPGKFRSAYSSSGMEGGHRHVGVGERPSTTNTLGDSQKEHRGNAKGK